MRNITIRNDTLAALNGTNPVLKDGQLCWAHDNNVLKIGDGETSWNELEDLLSGDQDAWAIGTNYYIPLPRIGLVRMCFKVRRDIAGKKTYYLYAYERGEEGVRRLWGNLNPNQMGWSSRNYAHMWDELPGDRGDGVVNLYYNVDIAAAIFYALREEVID